MRLFAPCLLLSLATIAAACGGSSSGETGGSSSATATASSSKASSASSSSTGGASQCDKPSDCPKAPACEVNDCEDHTCVLVAAPNNTPCDDGLYCTTDDICVSGECKGGPPMKCTADQCQTSVCDEAAKGCTKPSPVQDGVLCDDGDPCTISSTCVSGVCTPGPTCADTDCATSMCTPQGCIVTPKPLGTACGDPQCSDSACDGAGECLITPKNIGAACDDHLFCTTGETCDAFGQCTSTTPTCQPDPSQPCLVPVCSEGDQTCTTSTLPDGTACGDPCTQSTCESGVCVPGMLITTCGDADGCCPAGCDLTADTDCYWRTGVQESVDESALVGWTQCYLGDYGDNASLAGILGQCTGSKLLMACRPTGTTVWSLLAMAPASDVLFDCGTQANCTQQSNGVGWYFNNSFSWGFAPGGDNVNRDTCDFDQGMAVDTNLRVCWHTSGNMLQPGYRCGSDANFGVFDASYQRAVYEAN